MNLKKKNVPIKVGDSGKKKKGWRHDSSGRAPVSKDLSSNPSATKKKKDTQMTSIGKDASPSCH
jgi:hypothetical protein